MSKKRDVVRSIGYAVDGIKEATLNEPNMKVHLGFTIAVAVLGFIFSISSTEWLLITLCVASVFILELLNTAIEAVVDLASPKKHPKAKLAKDVAAGAVLVAAIASAIVGIFIFAPKIVGSIL